MGDSIPYALVDKINQRKDNPTFADKVLFNRKSDNVLNPYLPKRYAHRKYNHDPMSNFVIGNELGGTKGIEAMFLHDVEDMISDELVKCFGSSGRDIFEAMMNYSFTQHRKHDRHRRSVIRKLY